MSMDYQDECVGQTARSTASNTYTWPNSQAQTQVFVPNNLGYYYTSPLTLQQAIDIYKREFGENWKGYFRATVKVSL